MFWSVVKLIVSLGVGYYLFAFGGLQILIILGCAIPATKNFAKTYKVDKEYIYSRCAKTVVIWLVILIVLSVAVVFFFSRFVEIGFFSGMFICLLFSIGRCGMNQSNLSDYFTVYAKAFDPKDLEEILGAQSGEKT